MYGWYLRTAREIRSRALMSMSASAARGPVSVSPEDSLLSLSDNELFTALRRGKTKRNRLSLSRWMGARTRCTYVILSGEP